MLVRWISLFKLAVVVVGVSIWSFQLQNGKSASSSWLMMLMRKRDSFTTRRRRRRDEDKWNLQTHTRWAKGARGFWRRNLARLLPGIHHPVTLTGIGLGLTAKIRDRSCKVRGFIKTMAISEIGKFSSDFRVGGDGDGGRESDYWRRREENSSFFHSCYRFPGKFGYGRQG